jgi:hypothetical protein
MNGGSIISMALPQAKKMPAGGQGGGGPYPGKPPALKVYVSTIFNARGVIKFHELVWKDGKSRVDSAMPDNR